MLLLTNDSLLSIQALVLSSLVWIFPLASVCRKDYLYLKLAGLTLAGQCSHLVGLFTLLFLIMSDLSYLSSLLNLGDTGDVKTVILP